MLSNQSKIMIGIIIVFWIQPHYFTLDLKKIGDFYRNNLIGTKCGNKLVFNYNYFDYKEAMARGTTDVYVAVLKDVWPMNKAWCLFEKLRLPCLVIQVITFKYLPENEKIKLVNMLSISRKD